MKNKKEQHHYHSARKPETYQRSGSEEHYQSGIGDYQREDENGNGPDESGIGGNKA